MGCDSVDGFGMDKQLGPRDEGDHPLPGARASCPRDSRPPQANAPRQTAIVAITRRGREQGLQLQAGLPGATLYLLHGALPPKEVVDGKPSFVPYTGHLRDLVDELFPRTRSLVLICAAGIAVRLIAPHLVSKRLDPSVVVVDEQGRYAISLLSGHLGGANELAARVATVLGAQPIITTASDLAGTIAVDLVGAEYGWHIENPDRLTELSAALVNGLSVGLYQDAGERDWWPRDKPLPANVVRCTDSGRLSKGGYAAALLISDHLITDSRALPACTVIYRPRSLVLGIGCNRGTSSAEIGDLVGRTLREHGFSDRSIRRLATVDLKRDEAGLTAYADQIGVPISYFSAAELAAVEELPNPSAMVSDHVGTPGVCEPAALLAAATARLVIPKVKQGNVTLAVARIEDS
ncbi:MAG: cobalamin biosynthesis protein CbiG [Chloroflexota bacterium]|nr:MAG: cobalamin biosynthesis protein CbiG [Chloroflexota bacterium]